VVSVRGTEGCTGGDTKQGGAMGGWVGGRGCICVIRQAGEWAGATTSDRLTAPQLLCLCGGNERAVTGGKGVQGGGDMGRLTAKTLIAMHLQALGYGTGHGADMVTADCHHPAVASDLRLRAADACHS
jgi:hypothetical protein